MADNTSTAAGGAADKLIKLSDSDERFVAANDDIRDRSVKDRNGDDLGTVEDLLIDPAEHKVRFLVVASGGFLGIGEDRSFIPVDAVRKVTEDEVHVDQSRDRVAGAPRYDPDLVGVGYYDQVYSYYGFTPYWLPGYAYPAYPLY